MSDQAMVEIGVMKGYRGHMALDVGGKRHGPDAGPWTTMTTFRVPAAELLALANKASLEKAFDDE